MDKDDKSKNIDEFKSKLFKIVQNMNNKIDNLKQEN